MKTMADIADESRNKSKCATCKHSVAMGGDGWSACKDCIHDEYLRDRYEPATNANRIRSMSDEELAKFLLGVYCRGWSHGADDNEDADINFAKWLKQIYKEGTLP